MTPAVRVAAVVVAVVAVTTVAAGAPLSGSAAASAAGRASLPRGLTSPGAFEIRPAQVYFQPQAIEGHAVDGFSGPRTTSHVLVHGQPPRIHWSIWTRRRAVAHGTTWSQKCAERQGRRFDCDPGAFLTSPATLVLSRARTGRFTRLRIEDIDGMRDAFTPAYDLTRVHGRERWCSTEERRVCLGP